MRKLVALIIVALIAALSVPVWAQTHSEAYKDNIYSPGDLKPVDSTLKVKVGDMAPDFMLPSITGQKVTLLQTLLSGKSELPFSAFVLLMQPIHLAIGIVEGIVTAGVIRYVRSVRPEILDSVSSARPLSAGLSMKKAVLSFLALAIITGGALSWFASSHPDGLEWSLERVFGEPELPGHEQGVAATLKGIQEKTAVLPDYAFRQDGNERESEEAASWPAIEPGTSVSGFLGAVMVLTLSVLIGIGIRAVRKRAA